MRYYGYDEFKTDIQQLSAKLKQESPDAIVAISRGGMTAGHFLGLALDIRSVFVVNAISYFNKKQSELKVFNPPSLTGYKSVLIVDDIIDSGKSMQKVHEILTEAHPDINFKKVVLFYKKNAKVIPDYCVHEAESWINFFWEVDILPNDHQGEHRV